MLKLIDYDTYDVEDPFGLQTVASEDINFLLALYVGWESSNAESDFQVLVVSPEAIRNSAEEGKSIYDRKSIILLDSNFRAVLSFCEELLKSCSGETFHESCVALSKFLYWEYEEHRFTD